MAEGEYGEGYGYEANINVKHERRIFFVKDRFWIVTDRLDGEGGHSYTQIWKLSAEYMPRTIRIDAESRHIKTQELQGPNIAICHFTKAKLQYEIKYGEKDPYGGWFAAKYGEIAESADIRVNWQGDGKRFNRIYNFKLAIFDLKFKISLYSCKLCTMEGQFTASQNNSPDFILYKGYQQVRTQYGKISKLH